MKEATSRDRLFALDVLRGIAICLVLVYHAPVPPISENGGVLNQIFAAAQGVGWCGVDLFFVLSGFLISGLLFKELDRNSSLNAPRFWLRRGLKIWPSYFVAYGGLVALWCAADIVRGDWSGAHTWLGSIVPNGLFVQNYVASQPWPNSWSVAVEEHFYLMLPLTLQAFASVQRRRGRLKLISWSNQVFLGGAAVCLSVLGLRIFLALHGANWTTLYFQSHTRADALCFGVMLSYWGRYYPQSLARTAKGWPVFLIAPLVVLTGCWLYPKETSSLTITAGFTALYMAFGGWVLLAAVRPDFGQSGSRLLTSMTRPLALIGVYSYTIYLAHSIVYYVPGMKYFRTRIPPWAIGSWPDRVLFWLLAIGAGVLLSHAVERPVLRWREQHFPSHGKALLQATRPG
jgi:peptidoglycan/LPS O-acetylase OafA/YrhL